MSIWLKCMVSQGQFSDEYGIKGELFNGTQFSMFAPKNSVSLAEIVADGKSVSGWLAVDAIDETEGKVLISLPRPAFEHGRVITVQKDQLKEGK